MALIKELRVMSLTIREIMKRAYETADKNGFHYEESDGKLEFYKSAKLCLMHSEISEALEAIRKPDLKDKHLPMEDSVGLEMADVMIRIADFCVEFKIPLVDIIDRKLLYNETREYKHGKKF